MLSRRKLGRAEALEDRRLLAVTATVADGDLFVEGQADGLVEIVAVGEGLFQVYDDGLLVADESALQGVTDDLHVSVDLDTDNPTTVSIDLAGQSIDKVYADLGDGENEFTLTGGLASGLVYRGGDGVDAVNLGGEVDGRAFVWLGDGDNSLTVVGELGHVSLAAGDGNDTVEIEHSAVVDGNFSARLGDGDNAITHAGQVEGRFAARTGAGDDTVTVTADAVVGGAAMVALGDGLNTTTVAGEVGGALRYRGGAGDDTVAIDQTAAVDAVFAEMGAGENVLSLDGAVSGDLSVASFNEADLVQIGDAAVVAGEINLALGEQTDRRGGGFRGRTGGSPGRSGLGGWGKR